MDALDLAKLIGSGGFAAALLYLLYLVGSRMVAAIDRVAKKVDDHTAADLESHAEMRTDIAELRGELRGAVNGEISERYDAPDLPRATARSRTPVRGVPVGVGGYGPMRPSTKGER